MNRRRWGVAAVLFGMTALGGCSSNNCGGGLCSGPSLWTRLTSRPRLVGTSHGPICDGPALGDPAPCCGGPTDGFMTQPAPSCGMPNGLPTMPPANGAGLPPLAPAPRLVPQAQPVPAAPASNVKAIAR